MNSIKIIAIAAILTVVGCNSEEKKTTASSAPATTTPTISDKYDKTDTLQAAAYRLVRRFIKKKLLGGPVISQPEEPTSMVTYGGVYEIKSSFTREGNEVKYYTFQIQYIGGGPLDSSSSWNAKSLIIDGVDLILENNKKIEAEIAAKEGGTRSEVMEKLKKKAAKNWPNDYTTQEFWIDKQMEDYDYMKTIPDDKVKKKAQRDWPLDFTTQKFWYEKQKEAKERLNN